jgi:hypothetical protein
MDAALLQLKRIQALKPTIESVREFRDYSRLSVAYAANEAFFVAIQLSSHGENDVFR